MQVALTVSQRMALISILPIRGNYVDMIMLKSLKDKLDLTDKEVEVLKVRANGPGRIIWSTEEEKKLGPLKYDIGEGVEVILYTTLKELNDSKRLEESHLSLYELFVVNGKKPPEKRE